MKTSRNFVYNQTRSRIIWISKESISCCKGNIYDFIYKMKLTKTTPEVLAFKVLWKRIDQVWVDWAVAMLMAGYDTEHLRILAWETEPFYQFEMQNIIDKVLTELQIDCSDKDKIIKDYVCYLIDKSFDGEIESLELLNILKDLFIELELNCDYLYGFYLLYFAKDDLLDSEYQYHWDGGTRENIDKIITDYFVTWKATYFAGE